MDLEVVFPKYCCLGFNPEHNSSVLIRRGKPFFRGNDILCKYYRPCGEWSCIVKYNRYCYWYTFGFDGNFDYKSCEMNMMTPEEFLNDNGYCISEATSKMFKEAWEDIPEEIKDHQDIWEEFKEDGTSYGWMHQEFYKDLNYKYSNFG